MTPIITAIKNAWAKLFYLPSPQMLALRELEMAQRELLDMQTTRDYASHMANYHKARIARLTAYLKGEEV
jgi:hypothetical protein